ncbi:MAG: SurA N-terminal domain-containing protein [Bacteroidales bacterium]|nr:SurA N-terminal domain-containing protein [Bacteroidales bacterium]
MAAIGAIRKHGVALMIIIGFALLAFIVGDFSQLTALFSDKYTMASVDGEKINDQYSREYEENTALWKILYNKQSLEESETYQVHELTWNNLVETKLLDKQLKKLGLQYSDEMIEAATEEMVASLRTNQPNQLLAQMVNVMISQWGMEPQNVIAIIENMEDYKDTEGAEELYKAYKAIQRFNIADAKRMRYFGLAQGSLYFSDKMAEQVAANNKVTMASVAVLNPYAPVFNDVVPSVSDKEMKDWYNNHKSAFRVTENLRDIDIALFPVTPSTEDLKAIEDSVNAEYQRFVATPSLTEFNLAEEKGLVDSAYYTADDISIDVLDSLIFKRPVGSLIEPFTYQDIVWYYGKVYGSEMRPDSVLVAYLVVDFKNATMNPTGTRTKKQARHEADSLKQLVLAGADIFELMPNYLAGRQATDTTMWVPERGTIPTLYNEFVHTGNGGIYVHESGAAFVVYQILARTTPVEKRQFVVYTTPIEPSETTVKTIKSSANALAAASSNADELIDEANAQGVQVLRGTNVRAMDATINQLPNCREIVSWAFTKDIKVDNVSDVINLENRIYAVAAVRNIREKGMQKFESVKSDIENQLMAEKKVAMIAENVNKALASGENIQSLAAKYQSNVMDSVMLSFLAESYMNRNIEDAAIAGIFNMDANSTKAVAGKNYVYLASVGDFTTGAVSPNYMAEKAALRNAVVGRSRNESVIMQGLKNKVKILDQRNIFYVK